MLYKVPCFPYSVEQAEVINVDGSKHVYPVSLFFLLNLSDRVNDKFDTFALSTISLLKF